MSSSQRLKPKLPITPKSAKKGISNQVLQNKPSQSNSNHRRDSNMKRKPRLDIISSQTPPKRLNVQRPQTSDVPSSQTTQQCSTTFNWEDDDDDDLLATMNLDGLELPNEGSFKENQVNIQPTAKPPAPVQPAVRQAPCPPSQPSSNRMPPSNARTVVKNQATPIAQTSAISSHGVGKEGGLDQQLKEREGEIKNLRLELQKTKKTVMEMTIKFKDELKAEKLESEERYKKLKKELEKKDTELKFQKRDLAESEEKRKAVRSLHTLNSSRALFEDHFQELQHGAKEVSNPNPKRPGPKIKTYPKLTVKHHAGKILYDRLYPRLFDPPEQESEILIDQVEPTNSVNVSTVKNVLLTQTVAKPECNQRKTKPQPNKSDSTSNKASQMMSFSPIPFIPLYAMEALDSESASEPIRKIFLKCLKLLEKFLLILRKSLKYDESYEKRVCNLAMSCFKVAVTREDHCLLGSQRWYPDERGIEVRRAIVVLSELASLSVHAVNLVLRTSFTEQECNLANLFQNSLGVASEQSTERKRKPSTSISPDRRKMPRTFEPQPSTSRMDVVVSKTVNPSPKRNQGIETVEKFDVLQIIQSIVTEIYNQCRTLSFNGVLAAIVSLIKTLAEMDCDIPYERLNVINEIIKQIVFCCPGPAVIHDIVALMVPLSKYLTCLNSLCSNSVSELGQSDSDSDPLVVLTCTFRSRKLFQESFIDSRRHYTFTTETCVLQVLCAECEMIDKTPTFAENFTKWALKVTVDTSDCPNWLAGDCREMNCDCFGRFIQLFLEVLHYAVLTYSDEERSICELSKNQLTAVMKRGIIVLNRICLQRNDFLSQVGSWDGLLEAINHHLLEISKKVQFESPIHDMLNDLSYLHRVQASESSIQSQRMDDAVTDILMLSSQNISKEGFQSSLSSVSNLQTEKINASKKQRRKSVRK